jgi:TonB-dependent receptor
LQSDLTLTQLNGNFIATADSGDPSRSFNYLLLPSNMIGSVEVYKSPEARLDEGGVGGTVILKTRKPLDLKPWSGFISAEGTYGDVTEKVEPQISGQLSWHNKDRTFGVLVGATYQKRTNREMDGSTESWQWWTDGGRATGIKATDVNGKTFANDPRSPTGRRTRVRRRAAARITMAIGRRSRSMNRSSLRSVKGLAFRRRWNGNPSRTCT